MIVASVERQVFHYWSLSFLVLDLQGLQRLRVIGHAHVRRGECEPQAWAQNELLFPISEYT